MKKILASILVLTMLVCCMSISAFAEGAPARFSVDNASGEPGETITINVNIYDNTGITAGRVTLACEQFTVTAIAAGSWSTTGSPTWHVPANMYNWYSPNVLDTESGVYAVYTVEIDEDAIPGTYEMVLTSEMITDDELNEFDGETVKATLTVEGEIPHEHVYSSTWENDADNHWNECECGAKANEAAHVYADDADATCDICEYERHIHVIGTEWENDADNHWNECECGEKANEAAHVYADDADTTCDICEYERHIHNPATELSKDATGHWYACDCGEKVNAEAHVYADDADTTCDTCGYERTIGDDDKDDDKDDNKDDTAETGDNTNLYIYMAICLFAAAAIVVTSYQIKKNRG